MIKNVDEIKSKVDIIKVIQSFMSLKASGANYISTCPFHDERTPSFVVSKTKGIFHCFGCEVGGNAIDFIMRAKGFSFAEALREAAKICELEIDEVQSESYLKQKAWLDKINSNLALLSQKQSEALKTNNEFMEYLSKRGFDEHDVDKYGLGLCLYEKQISDIVGYYDAIDLGLLTNKGSAFFRGRLMISIKDATGKIVGFAGRILNRKDENNPKYINSKETFLYKKKNILYNLNVAKEMLKHDNRIYIVEGYFDALTFNKYGVPSVALGGKELTREHLRVLSNIINDKTKIILALDNDNAGRDATIRAIKLMFRFGFIEVEVGRVNKKYKDINEFYSIFKEKKEPDIIVYEALDYALKVEIGLAKSLKEKQNALKFYIDFLESCNDIFIKEYFIRILEKNKLLNKKDDKKHINYLDKYIDEKFILTQMTYSKEKAFLAQRVLGSEYFADSKVFLDILASKDTSEVRKYSLAGYEDIDIESFFKILKRFKLIYFKNKIKEHLKKNKHIDYKYIYNLDVEFKKISSSL